jgi:hypothetical protein
MASTTTSTSTTNRANVAASFRGGLQSSTALTDSGIDWLVSALDPFSSSGTQLAGFPDNMGARSVVMEKVASITLSGADLSNGTLSVYMAPYVGASDSANPIGPMNTATLYAANRAWPFDSNNVSVNSMGAPAISVDSDNTSYFSGGLVVDTDGPFPDFAVQNGYKTSFTTDATKCLGHGITAPHRVIGMGFEVLNETAPLYKSGNVIVYEHPLNLNDICYSMNLGGNSSNAGDAVNNLAVNYSQQINTVMGPPINPSQMLSQLNSKQWPAEHGCYCVSKMESSDAEIAGNIAFQRYGGGMVYQNTDGSNTNVPGCYGGEPLVVTLQGIPNPGQLAQLLVARQSSTYLYNFNGSGAFFTGLDTANTSLTITARWVIEVFPSPYRNDDLIPLATASASFDPDVLDVYGKISQYLPPGLPSRSSYIAQVPSILKKFKKVKNGRS